LIGEITAFANALITAATNTLGGKSTQLSNWRTTLRYSSLTALIIIATLSLFNLENLFLNSWAIGFVAGFCGGLGLPPLYKAIATGAVSFVSPVVALTQSFFLILFAITVKDESLSWSFPIAATLGAVGIFLCSRQASGNQPVTFSIFLLAITAGLFFSGCSLLLTGVDSSQILGVFTLSLFLPPKKNKEQSQGSGIKFALLSGSCEVIANINFMIAINNLELSKVGIFIAATPALSTLIAIKLLHQRPSVTNWIGIGASSGALAIIALN
jgi:drug/metabolite transporter (DMT)-like permease